MVILRVLPAKRTIAMTNASATTPALKPRTNAWLSLPQYLEERTPAKEPRKDRPVRATTLIIAVARKDCAVEGPLPDSIAASKQ